MLANVLADNYPQSFWIFILTVAGIGILLRKRDERRRDQ